MNQQPGLIPQWIRARSLDFVGLLFVLLIVGLRYTYQGAAALGLVVALPIAAIWILTSRSKNIPLQIPKYSWAYLPLILSGILAVVNSIRPTLSLEELLIWALNLVIVLFVINRENKRGLLICLVIVGILYAQIQIPEAVEVIGTKRLTHPNNAGALLNVFMTAALAVILNSNPESKTSLAAIACWALSAGVMLTTGSRAALLAGVAGDLVVLGISSSWISKRGRRWIMLAIGSRIAQAAALLATRTIAAAIPTDPAVIASVPRVAIYQAGWSLFTQYPLFGSGLKTFLLINQAAGPVIIGQYMHPHNIYLATLSQMGLVGFAAVALALLVAIWQIWTGCPDQMIRASALAAVVTMLVHGILDNPYFEPYNMRAVLIPLALALPTKGLTIKMITRGPNYQNDDCTNYQNDD